MGFRLTKKEVETLGNRFAEMLLFSKEANPGILPDLVSRRIGKAQSSTNGNKLLQILRDRQERICWRADTTKSLL